MALLQLNGADRQQPAVQATLRTLAEAHEQIAELLTSTQPAPARAPVPCELRAALRALVEGEFAHSFEEIGWQGGADGEGSMEEGTVAAVYVDALVGEVVLGAAREALRNAAAHGRGGKADRPLHIRIDLCVARGDMNELALTIADDGVGFGAGSTVAAALPGGSGNGLALHSTLLALVGGYLTVTVPPAGGTQVRIAVPKGS
jgi:nitrate/nitrite-specific signal transduction histidine kinase